MCQLFWLLPKQWRIPLIIPACVTTEHSYGLTGKEVLLFFLFSSPFFPVQSSERLTVREITETLEQNLSAPLIDCLIPPRASEATAAPPTDKMVEGGGKKSGCMTGAMI